MRENMPPPYVFTGATECRGAHSHACHTGARDFPRSRVYSRGPLRLENLGFQFERGGMRYRDVACLRTSLPRSFTQVPQSAGKPIRMHATPALVISRRSASIPEVPWV